jgi:acyl-coenzyme A synthetase/AMP-(fatty) acid ligase
MHWRVSDLVDRLAGERRTGLIFVDEHGHRRDYSFAEVASHSARYAAVLRAFGVHEGERVYVRLSTTGKCIFTLLALERLGAQPVLDATAAAGASTIVSNRKHRASVDAAREHFASEARYIIIGEEREGWARLDTLAQIAAPAEIAKRDFDETQFECARADAAAHLQAVPTDVVWCALQIDDEQWFAQSVVQPWLCGATAVAHNGLFDARERLDLIRELDVSILQQRVDDYHAELALPDSTRFKMPRLRRCMVLGEGCDDLLQTQWEQRFGVPLSLFAKA